MKKFMIAAMTIFLIFSCGVKEEGAAVEKTTETKEVSAPEKETLKKEFKIKKYRDTSGNINRWMITSDSLRKTPYNEWVNTPITVIGNQELVGGDTTEYRGRYKVYESKDGGLNYFLKYVIFNF